MSDGYFRLDGGAMFGVVPRVMWQEKNPPDEMNRILLGLRPLLIQTNDENILVDSGIGDKGDERFMAIYGIDRSSTLKDSLGKIGLKEDDISMVINTHLHFDHAGGNTVRDENGVIRPVFRKARYIVQRGEWEDATHTNERTRGSYHPEDFVPVMEEGQFDLIDGNKEIAEGISVFVAPGHNRHIELVKIESGGDTALFLSDIIPTTSHISYPYIMAYDLFPLKTLEVKKEILMEAARKRWLLIFEHDPREKMGYVRMKGDKPVYEPLL